jgi:hypothetical protein
MLITGSYTCTTIINYLDRGRAGRMGTHKSFKDTPRRDA